MRRPLIAWTLLVAVASASACSGDPDRAPGAAAGTDAGVPLDGAATADGGEEPGFDGNTTPACVTARGAGTPTSGLFEDGADRTTVAVKGAPGCARSFDLSTNVPQRDGRSGTRTVAEIAGLPSVQTKSDTFDALYALALTEAREDSVSEIKDGAFGGGAPIDCGPGGCFQTGEKWTYVWTRDTAYSMHLGLAALDPLRARTSLLFKVSARRDGFATEIVQDTGSGGSYPVSTDRVVWALGAWQALAYLTGDARVDLRDRAWTAIRGTIERDRKVAFDARDGLYRGEESFLDWREQTYASWTATDVVPIAESRALSTNVAHLELLEIGARLAEEKGDGVSAALFAGFAKDLRERIRARFLLADERQLASYVGADLDPSAVRRHDLLGTSLAILYDVTTSAEAREALSRYPHTSKGAPVVWPQEQDVPIYHNRALWPFVTAYALRAARKVRHDGVANRAIDTLVRGAALSLSNMENFEAVTGKTWVSEGATSGPVVNSPRQLWSVAGYLSMVHDVIFGLEATPSSIRFLPYVPKRLRNGLLAGSDTLVLNNFPYHDRRITVVVKLPPAGKSQDGAYAIGSVRLNGRTVGEAPIDEGKLSNRNTLEIELADLDEAPAAATLVSATSEYRNVFAPRPPRVGTVTLDQGKLKVTFDAGGEKPEDVTFRVYRDGAVVADKLPGTTVFYTDAATSAASPSHCYSVEARFASGNASHHARPVCFWGAGAARVISRPASDFTAVGGAWVTDHGRSFYQAWGDPGHKLTTRTFTAQATGDALVQLVYGNGAGPVSTGITCAVKLVRVEDAASNAVAAQGYVVMPQRGTWGTWGDSTSVRAALVQGKAYRVVVTDDAAAVNMSAFSHFERYTGGTGGASGPFFRVNLAEVKVLALSGP